MIHELFEKQVDRTPQATALVFQETKLTYHELNQRADKLARQLRALRVGPDVLVAIFLERSLEMVVGLLAVLKAGGAYVPLDPAHPTSRIAAILADAQPAAVLTQTHMHSKLPPQCSTVVTIDADLSAALAPEDEPAAKRASSPNDLAYVIFTSGSTGKPKGVEVEHRSVVNMLESMRRRPGLGAEDLMLAITTPTFDIAALEIFLPLVCGACVVIAPSEVIADGVALADLLERCGATVMQATPSTWRMLLDAGWRGATSLKILCGGEAWTPDLANQLLVRCASLWNMYGPTETTVWSAVAKVEAGGPIVIGPPIANTKFYVLDSALQLLPVGVPGELCIGGAGLARGYLHQPDLTRERFVGDPYGAKPGARMYRTGDLVRRLPGGVLEFLGRLDQQVKIDGHRIELGEIEAALLRHEHVAQTVVMAREDRPGQKRLVAYVVPSSERPRASDDPGSSFEKEFTSQLRDTLQSIVPAYMVPSAFVLLDRLPLMPNGKLDRKALPPPEKPQQSDVSSIEPRNPTEGAMARIWCELLDLKKIGVRDNFFELGGNSLLAARVIGRINETFKAKLNVGTLFLAPNIESLAASLKASLEAKNNGPNIRSFRNGHVGPPLYFIGAGPVEYRIAERLDANRAVFAVDVPMPMEWRQRVEEMDHSGLPTIEQLGALFGEAIYLHAGSRLCVISGYSIYGKIAFEAAHALQRAGGNVALVLLIDAFAWTGLTLGTTRQSLSWIWRKAWAEAGKDKSYAARLGASVDNYRRLFWWLLTQMPRVARSRLVPGHPFSGMVDNEGTPVDPTLANKLVRILGKSFHPSPLDASCVLIRARLPGEDMLPGHDFTNGWGDLFTRGIDVVQANGEHVSIVSEDWRVAKLAQQIDAALNRLGPDKQGAVSRRAPSFSTV